MRPLELRIRGFRSYFGEDVVIDFRGRRLVGIVGPIGAGKSSILDAMSFALYGRTPAVAANTRSLIHQRADGLMVAFRFGVGGEVWEAVRALRRRGPSQHLLSRLTTDSQNPEIAEKVTLESDVNARVVELLGLDFDGFSKSVLLSQGRFSDFLRSRPGERDSVLKGVFSHDRIDVMRAAAREQVAALMARLGALDTAFDQYERLKSEVAERTRERKTGESRIDAMRKAEEKHADLTEHMTSALATTRVLEDRREQLDTLQDRLPNASHVVRTVNAAVEAAKDQELLVGECAAAQVQLVTAEELVSRMDKANTRDTLDRALALLAIREPLERRRDELRLRVTDLEKHARGAVDSMAKHRAAVSVAELRVSEAAAKIDAAREEVREAERTLHSARHMDMASTLRRSLVDGVSCPVCAQHVATAPPVIEQPILGILEKSLARAQEADRAVREEGTEATSDARAAVTALTAVARSVERANEEAAAAAAAAEAAVDEADSTTEALSALLGLGDPVKLSEGLRIQLSSASDDVSVARKMVERVRRQHDEAVRHQQDVRKALSAISHSIVDLAARLDASTTPIDDENPETVGISVVELREFVESERAAVTEALSASSRGAREAKAALDDLSVDLELEGDLAAILAREEARIGWLGEEITKTGDELAVLEETLKERSQAQADLKLFEQLTADLTDTRFVRFLLDDVRSRLADLGSEHFQRLSANRYRFTDDGKFDVVDLAAAGAVRKAQSLSGGETFLASLGLALALAEMVGRSGGRLDAFFLDEGFGTLDSEHLDLAMEGIERLASVESRLVVVVSHVRELRDRIEDLIELDRSPLTGDTLVVHP